MNFYWAKKSFRKIYKDILLSLLLHNFIYFSAGLWETVKGNYCKNYECYIFFQFGRTKTKYLMNYEKELEVKKMLADSKLHKKQDRFKKI